MSEVLKWELTFQQATKEDIPVIFAQSKTLIEQYEDIYSIDYSRVLEWMQKKLEENIAQYTRIVAEGKTVGYYCLESREGETELDDFYILPPFRGQGIGTSVLQKCFGEITQPVFLYVFRGNTGAIRLYNRMGFVRAEDVSKTRMIMRRDG